MSDDDPLASDTTQRFKVVSDAICIPVRGHHQARIAEEANDRDPSVGVDRGACKPAAAYTGGCVSTGSVQAGGPYGRGITT